MASIAHAASEARQSHAYIRFEVNVLARNEAGQVSACSALGRLFEGVLVADMESNDGTLEAVSGLCAKVLHIPTVAEFDRAENQATTRSASTGFYTSKPRSG